MAEQLGDRNAAYHGYVAYQIRGTLDVPALERALQILLQRHDALRSRVVVEQGQGVPLLIADLPATARVQRIDLRKIGPSREDMLDWLLEHEVNRPFDLASEHPLRILLARASDDEELLVVVLHHLFTDAWSMQIFLRELVILYTGCLEGRQPELPKLSAQYADFVRWQRDWLRSEAAQAQLSYWERHLRDAERFDLLTDGARPLAPTFSGAVQRFSLDESVLRALKHLAARERVTLFMTVLGAFQLTLGRWNGSDAVTVGTPVANRTRPEFESVIGFFVNMLVMRTHLDGAPDVGELLRRVRDTTIAAFSNQDIPFERVVERVQPVREHGRNPLFQIAFALQNASADLSQVRLPQVELSRIRLEPRRTRFDIECYVAESYEGLNGWLLYSDELFDAATIKGLVDAYCATLVAFAEGRTRAAAAPQPKSESLPLLAADAVFEPVHFTIKRQSQKTPNHIAIDTGDERITFTELDARVTVLARRLRSAGLMPGGLCGIAEPRSVSLIVSVLAVLECGAAYVPIDPQHPPARLAEIVRAAGLQVLIAPLGSAAAALPFGGITIPPGSAALTVTADEVPVVDVTPDSLAYVLFTSGSTGRPKGVMIPHRALANHMRWLQHTYPLDGNDRVLFRTTPTFDASVWELFWPLMTGGTLILATPARQQDGKYLAQLIRHSGVTVAQFVPSLLEMLLDDLSEALPDLRHVFCGGEPLPAALAHKLTARTSAALHNLYGPTETCIDATCWDCVPPFDRRALPIGQPITNVTAYVLDEAGMIVPTGALGEIYIGGAGLARGYLGAAALTAERFLPDPFSAEPGARCYRTGDLGRRRGDGTLEFERRADDQIKLYGHRIELGEIESLAATHPDCTGAAAVVANLVPSSPGLACFVTRHPSDIAIRRRPERVSAVTQELLEWQRVHDGIIKDSHNDYSPDLNFAGWRSSFSENLYGASEMREWRDAFVSRVLTCGPRRILEIGCGSGMILHGCAAACDEYWGTDFSDRALEVAAIACRQFPNVRLLNRRADDFSGIPSGYFDVVVLNSVIQYFPGLPYFEAVLTEACRAIRAGGAILLGDVRLLPLLPAFHAAVAMHAEPPTEKVGNVRLRAARDIANERELVIHPEALLDFKRRHPQLVSDVELYFKHGSAPTEMNAFRADFILRQRPGADSAAEHVEGWSSASWRSIRATVERTRGTTRIADVPNARVTLGWLVSDALEAQPRDVDFRRAIDEALDRQRLVQSTAIAPDDWFQLARETGRVAELTWPRSGDYRCYDVVIARNADAAAAEARLTPGQDLAATALANDPMAPRKDERFAADIDGIFAAQLAHYARPTRIHVVPALPRLPSGKIDRAELGRWAIALERESDAPASDEAAATDLEELVLQVWSEVLKREIAPERSFFDAGGHSLLAVQALGRLNAELNLNIPLSAVFVHPSARKLAAWLSTQPAATSSVHDPARSA